MSKIFKDGDKVRRTGPSYEKFGNKVTKHNIYIVEKSLGGLLLLQGIGGQWYSHLFELVEPAIEIGDKMYKIVNNTAKGGSPSVLRTFETQSEAEEYAESLITGQVHTSVSVCQELIRMERKIEVSRVPV